MRRQAHRFVGLDEGQGDGEDDASEEQGGDEALVVHVFVGHVEAG